MSWCFAIINNKIGEIYFDKVRRGGKTRIVFEGHCYVKKGEIKNKEEIRAMKEDIAKYHLSYRNGKYRIKK